MKPASARATVRFTKIAAAWIVLLLLLHWAGVYLSYAEPGRWDRAIALFDLDREQNVPTVTNAFLLLCSSLVSVVLFMRVKKYAQKVGWLIMSLFFLYISIDELFILHEQIAEPVRKLMGIGNSNPLYHAWVVPALFVIIILTVFALFIHHFYKDLRVFSGVLKLIVILATGVVALEIVGTFVYENTVFYRSVMVPLEEIYELSMAAVIVRYLARQTAAKP